MVYYYNMCETWNSVSETRYDFRGHYTGHVAINIVNFEK